MYSHHECEASELPRGSPRVMSRYAVSHHVLAPWHVMSLIVLCHALCGALSHRVGSVTGQLEFCMARHVAPHIGRAPLNIPHSSCHMS